MNQGGSALPLCIFFAMEIDPNHLPTDTNALQAMVRQLLGALQSQSLKIAELEAHIAKLKRSQFGQSSEKIALEIEQLEQELDALHEEEAAQALALPAAVQALIEKPYRKACRNTCRAKSRFMNPPVSARTVAVQCVNLART
jgi:Transposase C of IS166 homeodomain